MRVLAGLNTGNNAKSLQLLECWHRHVLLRQDFFDRYIRESPKAANGREH
jgi:hypothetical protein